VVVLVFMVIVGVLAAAAVLAWSDVPRLEGVEDAAKLGLRDLAYEQPEPGTDVAVFASPGPEGIGSWRLRIRAERGQGSRLTADLLVGVELPAGAGIRAEGLFGGDDPAVGDDRFDGQLTLQGDVRWLSAVLDAETRERIADATRQGVFEVGGRHLRSQRQLRPAELGSLGEWVQDAIAIAQALSPPADDWPRRLLQVATEDPAAKVRFFAGQRLLQTYPDTELAQAFAVRALNSEVAALHLDAARAQGEAGKPALVALARDFSYPHAEERVAAIEAATELVGEPTADAWLPELLGSVEDDVQGAAFAAAARLQRPDLLVRPDGGLRFAPTAGASEALARALLALRAPASQRLLVSWLRQPEPQVRQIAAEALGAFADVRAVAPLRALEGSRAPGDARAASRAIASIQSRVGPAGAGGLAVVSEDAGQLSLAQQEGELTLTADPGAGALSEPRKPRTPQG